MLTVRTFAEGTTIYHPGDKYPRAGQPAPDHVAALMEAGLIREEETTKEQPAKAEKPKRAKKTK